MFQPNQRVKVDLSGMTIKGVSFSQNVREAPGTIVQQASAEPAGTVLRLPMVYGPFDRQRRLQPYLQRMEARRPAILLEAGQSAWRVSRGFFKGVKRVEVPQERIQPM